MKIIVFVIQILLGITFVGAGAMKLITPYADLVANPQMAWAEDFSSVQIKLIAILELAAALGLLIPLFVKKFKNRVPIAALIIGFIMIGAGFTHLMREESFIVPLILLWMAATVFWYRRRELKKD